MKGIVFTLDAVFALIIAGSGIAILTYFVYTPNTTYVLGASSLTYWWSSLSGTTLSSLTTPPLIPLIINQADAHLQDWPMGADNQYNNAGNPVGPSVLTLSYVFNAPYQINPGTTVARQGSIYFTAGNIIFAINSSTEGTLWVDYAPANALTGTSSDPQAALVYGKLLIYATQSDVVALDIYTGAQIWDTPALWNQGVATEPSATDRHIFLSMADGRLLVGTNDSSANSGYALYALYPYNGTVAGVSSDASSYISSEATAGGSQILALQPGASGNPSVNLYTGIYNNTSAAAKIWSYPLPGTPSGVATYGNIIVYGAADSANIISLSGNPVASVPLGSPATGVNVYDGHVLAQSYGAITLMNQSGNVAWSDNLGSAYGQAGANYTPLASSQYVYSLWGGDNVVVQNIATGAVVAHTQIPYSGSLDPHMALVYGRLIVSKGTHLMAFGSCWLHNVNDSALYSAYFMFLMGEGSCARVLIATANMPLNYSSYLAVSGVPLTFATLFSGSSMLETSPATPQWYSCNFTLLAWSYDLGMPNLKGGVADYYSSTGSNTMSIEYNDSTIKFSASGPLVSNTIYYTGNFLDNWTLTAITVTQGYVSAYVDGRPAPGNSDVNIGCIGLNQGTIGYQDTYFNGNIVNVQLYNSSLTASQISQLSQQYLQMPPHTATPDLLQWLPLEGTYNNYAQPYTPAYQFGRLPIELVNYVSPYEKSQYTYYSQSLPIIIPQFTNYTKYT